MQLSWMLFRRVAIPVLALLVAGANPAALGEAPRPIRPEASPSASPSEEARTYLLMTAAELQALPTSGPAWDYLVESANASWPAPDFADQDNQTGTLALAAALVYARTGDEALRAKARDAILAVIPTFDRAPEREGLGPLRQTASWVLAADFVDLTGQDDEAFRSFLQRVLSERTGSHSRWNEVAATHDDAANNWGAWAGAARIAASLYLQLDVTDAARTVRGFLGERGAWASFQGQKDPLGKAAAAWACDASPEVFTPVNPPCVKESRDLDGAIPADVSRGSDGPGKPPSRTGIMYSLETLAGYALQAELLYASGDTSIYEAGSQALRRMADFISRTEASGGPGWNPGRVQFHVPWLLNYRYGTSYPTVPAEYGRSFGYTDWLYGE